MIRAGVDAGALTCDDPAASAWRLACLLDGLGVQLTLHTRTLTYEAMLDHARTAASQELSFDRSALP